MVENSSVPVIPSTGEIIFYYSAPWCGPCKNFGPLLERVCADGDMPIQKILVDDAPEFVYESGIRSVPTIRLYRDGQVVATAIGAMSESQLRDWLNERLG